MSCNDSQLYTYCELSPPLSHLGLSCNSPNLLEKKQYKPLNMKFILCRRCFTVKNPGTRCVKILRKRNRQKIRKISAPHLLQRGPSARTCRERARGFPLHTSSRPSVNTSARQKVESDAQLFKFTAHILQIRLKCSA
jgi:hypothetical protein